MAIKRSRSGKKLMAKAVDMRYGYPGELMEGWEARPIDGTRFEIVRHNGTSRIMHLGEQIKVRDRGAMEASNATVSRSDSGVLMVGNKSVIIGNNIKHGFQARASGKSHSYLLLDDKLRQIGRVMVGQNFQGQPVSLVDTHLIKVGEDIFPIVPKVFEIALLVMKKPYEGGYLSFINVIERGNVLNREDGTMGALVPPKNYGEPARFVETFKGKLVTTAMFWPDEKGSRLVYHSRDADTALEQLKAEDEMNAARRIAIEAGLKPEEFAEYNAAMRKIEQYKHAWEKKGMALIVGPEIFKPHDPKSALEEQGIGYN